MEPIESRVTVAPATQDEPDYFRIEDTLTFAPGSPATKFWMIVCDEGWRQSIVCIGMYDWAADWLLSVLGRQPYAPGLRP